MMKKNKTNHVKNKLVLISSFFLFQSLLISAAEIPSYFTDKIFEIPDLCQADKRAGFPEGGKEYCCVVAVSNSLMWLGKHGYPQLVDNGKDDFETQVRLINVLASSEYMNTDPLQGTGTQNIIRGLRKYIESKGCSIRRLDYQGWRKCPDDMKVTDEIPGLRWIQEGLYPDGCVWLNIGWYSYNRGKDEYERLAGHWITVVGYGQDQDKKTDRQTLIVHDPSSRTGNAFSNQYLKAGLIRSGKLTGMFEGLPRNARDYIFFKEGLPLKPGADCAIVDGAIVLSLEPPASLSAKERIEQARGMLTGKSKDIDEAYTTLIDLAGKHPQELSAKDYCYIYVYLGYIEDHRNQRQKAKDWFEKAAQLEEPGIEGIRQVARTGLTNPVLVIRHLDKSTEITAQQIPTNPDNDLQANTIARIRDGYILSDPPKGLTARTDLTQEQMLENFDILADAIDRYYSFFEIKNIDWPVIVSAYRKKIEQASTPKYFYYTLYEFVKELKDSHSWLDNYKDVPKLEPYSPGVCTEEIQDHVVITYVDEKSEAYRRGLRQGCTILSIDGQKTEACFNKIRPYFRAYSSERIYKHTATESILHGKQNSKVQVECIPYNSKQAQTFILTRSSRGNTRPKQPDLFSLTRGKYVWYGRFSPRIGYIRILSFSGRNDIADEFDAALETLKDTDAMILDIRDNPGGFGTSHNRIIGRLIAKPIPGIISYQRSGSQHSDFSQKQNSYEPCGSWQYTKPVGLLMNTVTGSASDLFAAALIGADRVIAIGQPTHGNSTGYCVYVQLPCSLVVRISNGYLCNAKGKITEVSGNEPTILIEPLIKDVIENKDGVLERAFEYIKQQTK